MNNLTTSKIFFLIACLSLFSPGLKAEPIHQWEVYTISLQFGKVYSNPYQDIPATAGGDLLIVPECS